MGDILLFNKMVLRDHILGAIFLCCSQLLISERPNFKARYTPMKKTSTTPSMMISLAISDSRLAMSFSLKLFNFSCVASLPLSRTSSSRLLTMISRVYTVVLTLVA
jgi:hypothetical protein